MKYPCLLFSKEQKRSYKRYIEMCEKAEEIQAEHRWMFKEGDCFYHPEVGVQEILRIRDDVIVSTTEREADCLLSKCTWLPSKEDIEEMGEGINLNSDGLKMFLEDNKGVCGYRRPPKSLFRTPEGQWLAHFMFERYGKIWDTIKKDWIQIEKR